MLVRAVYRLKPTKLEKESERGRIIKIERGEYWKEGGGEREFVCDRKKGEKSGKEGRREMVSDNL
jgi:hypothetical protein